MVIRLTACCLATALVATSAPAAPSVFWPFGFYFPDKDHHRSGGFGAADQPPAAGQLAQLAQPIVVAAAPATPPAAVVPAVAGVAGAGGEQVIAAR